MAEDDIVRYSMDDLVRLRAEGKGKTRPDAPEYEVDDDFWRNARIVLPSGKTSVHLRVDTDVLEWFRGQGKGHLSRMNAVLRSYMEAHRRD